jgi:hypothetical protein
MSAPAAVSQSVQAIASWDSTTASSCAEWSGVFYDGFIVTAFLTGTDPRYVGTVVDYSSTGIMFLRQPVIP